MRKALLVTTALVASVGVAHAQTTACTLGSLAYSISNAPASGGSMVLQNLNGNMDLMVWGESGSTSSTVQLGTTYSTASVFDPEVSKTTPIATYSNVSQIPLTVGDHPLIVQLGSPVGGAPVSNMTSVQAKSVQSFVSSIGVDTHVAYTGTTYANPTLELQELNYLGINRVREQPPGPDLPTFIQLARSGVQFDIVTASPSTLLSDVASTAALAQAVPGSVLSVEGPNELNGGQQVYLNGQSSQNAGVGAAIQANVAQAVRSNPILAEQNVKIVNVSINNGVNNWQSYVAGLGNLDSSVDFANWHVYFNGAPPQTNIDSMLADAEQSAPGKPVEITESGYSTQPGGTSLANQESYTLDLLADASKAGVAQVDLYELMDNNTGSGNPEDNYGLFTSGGQPKPVATALANTISILEGSANAATTQSQAGFENCAAPSTVMAPPSASDVAQAQADAAQAPTQAGSTQPAPAPSTAAPASSLSVAQVAAIAASGQTAPAVNSSVASTAAIAADPGAVLPSSDSGGDSGTGLPAPQDLAPVRTVDSPSGTSPTPEAVSASVSYDEAGNFQTLVPSPGNGTGTISGNSNVIAATGGVQTIMVTGTGNQLILGPYSDTVTLEAGGNTVDGGGGNDTIILQYPPPAAPLVINASSQASAAATIAAAGAIPPLTDKGNTFVAPAPGTGTMTIVGTLASADRIDVTAAVIGLAGYDGANWSSYVTVGSSAGGCALSVQGQAIVVLQSGCPSGNFFVMAEH